MKILRALTLSVILVSPGFAQNRIVRDISCQAATASGSTYACSAPVSPGAYVPGTIYKFKADVANTGVATINFNGLGPITAKKMVSGAVTDLAANDIGAGQWVISVYDGTYMQTVLGGSGAGGGSSATVTFTAAATSGTFTHNLGTVSHSVDCVNVNNLIVIPTTLAKGINSDAFTFTGGLSANTVCVATAGSGAAGTGTGITSLNGLTGSSQTFAAGTAGTDFGISSSGTVHTFNGPSASSVNRGFLTAADWTTFNAKQAALGVTNDTNVTGSVAGATLTLGWAGALAKARQHAATVYNDQANTGTAAMTLDRSASTTAGGDRVPNIAGGSTTVAGALLYDPTNKNFHGGANGVDNIIPVVPTSLTIIDSNCVSWSNVAGVITLKQAAGACAAGGSGTVNSGTQGQLAWYASSTTAVSGNANFALNAAGTAWASIAGLTTAGTGTPIILGVSDVTAQSASQGTVTIATAPVAGNYRLHYYANQNALCTTGSNSVSFTFNWTDAGNARSLTTGNLALTTAQSATTGYLNGEFGFWVASGNVSYTSTVAGACASGTSSYDLHSWLERGK